MKRQFIKPSALGVLLLLCLLYVLASAMQGSSTVRSPSSPPEVLVERQYGLPPMVLLRSRGPSEDEQGPATVHVEWGTVVTVLAVGWVLAMPVGRWITGYARRDGQYAGPHHTGWRHPAAIVAYVVVGCTLAGTLLAIGMQRTQGLSVSFAEATGTFTTLLMLPAVPVTLIVMIVRRWRHRGRVLQRGFAVNVAPSPTPAAPG